MGFAQHQSFYLRPQWLNKGMDEIQKDSRFFYQEDHFERLGIGKNMAKSVRYWMNATKVMKDVKTTTTEQHLTHFGSLVHTYDPYLQKTFTVGLLHYFLTTDESIATTWYWFFNIFKEDVFDRQTVMLALEKWVGETQEKAVSTNSLKRDIDCLFLTYLNKNFENATPEDVIRSPFEELGLLMQTIRTSYTKMPLVDATHYDLLYAALLIYAQKHHTNELSISDLVNEPELWGKIFNLNRSTIVEAIEEMQKRYPIVFTRTNRLDIVRLKNVIEPLDFIEQYYKKEAAK
ncbi:DUF4007 family protein [Domibacillus sp. PGB-M46]|uniref:DUF4007 family protein n=1 Tax=Domibacillus sp. PGB-M46 TaxID=2910255 RepID=UPI001F593CAA|nr:DUF4007 family protein [Domibacillus sp. PGB-M46]MCI2254778.1 DUF4007 family protein [Domibacillus sp. PGB-M46]